MRAMMWRAAAAACFLAVLTAPAVAAQSMDIRTPHLPPRASATQIPGTTQPGDGGSPSSAHRPGYGQQPGHGQQPSYNGAPQAGFGNHSGIAIASPMQQRRGLAQQGPYGGASGQPPVAMVASPSSSSGNCRAQPSPDRQTLSLIGADGLPRKHVPLGEFRVQSVVHAQDGAWAVALTKLRGESQYAAITLDLARCESGNTVTLPAAGEDVRFEADTAIVRLAQGEHRVPLRSGVVR